MIPRAGLIFGVFLVSTACKNDPPPTQSAPAQPTSSAIPEDFVVNGFIPSSGGKVAVKVDGGVDFGGTMGGEDVSGGKTKVLTPGAEPRAALAYNLALNKTTTVNATVESEMRGNDIPEGQGKQPPIKFTLAVTPKKKDGPKTQVEFKVTKLDIGGNLPDEAKKQIASLQTAMTKVVGSVNVSLQGEVTDLKLTGAEGLPRGSGEQIVTMLDRVLELLVIPLPPQPIGAGGRWQMATSVPEEGASVTSTYTYVAKGELGHEIKIESNRLVAGRTVRDQRGKTIIVEVKSMSEHTVTTTLDGPTVKANGETKTDVITQAQGEERRVNSEKSSVTIEREGPINKSPKAPDPVEGDKDKK